MEKRPRSEGPSESPSEDPLVKAGVKRAPAFGSAGKYFGLGFQFAASILFFLWIGQWVDRKLETNGLFVLLGVFLGAGAAFYSMYRNLMADQRREEAELARKRATAERDKTQ